MLTASPTQSPSATLSPKTSRPDLWAATPGPFVTRSKSIYPDDLDAYDDEEDEDLFPRLTPRNISPVASPTALGMLRTNPVTLPPRAHPPSSVSASPLPTAPLARLSVPKGPRPSPVRSASITRASEDIEIAGSGGRRVNARLELEGLYERGTDERRGIPLSRCPTIIPGSPTGSSIMRMQRDG